MLLFDYKCMNNQVIDSVRQLQCNDVYITAYNIMHSGWNGLWWGKTLYVKGPY